MRKVFILTPVLLLLVVASIAQQKPSCCHASFQTMIQAGVAYGSNSSALTIQSNFGLSLSKTFVGLGTGIDDYLFRSVPLFLDLRQEFGKGNITLFVYGDAGKNFQWVTEQNKLRLMYTPGDFKSGKYYEGGLGWRFKFRNSASLLLSGGYSVKSIKKVNETNYCPVTGTCFYFSDKFVYNMSRIVFRLGCQF
jgi:hypothetical protein